MEALEKDLDIEDDSDNKFLNLIPEKEGHIQTSIDRKRDKIANKMWEDYKRYISN